MMDPKQETEQQHPKEPGTHATSGAVIISRFFGLLVILIGLAMIIVPLIKGVDGTLTLYAFFFSGVGFIAIGYGLLQLYLWGLYLLVTADIVAICSLIFTFRTLPFFKSFLIVVCLIIAGYFLLNREIFKRSPTI